MVRSNSCLVVALYLAFFFGSRGEDSSLESQKLYHDISAGRGLYNKFNKIESLNVTNFRNVIFNNSNNNAWLVEFYNSWCGHCHRFSTTWKQFALDVYGWRDVIKIAAVDCSNPVNTPLCRDFEVMSYPLLKYFPPLPAKNFLGMPVKIGDVDYLHRTTLKMLVQDAIDGTVNQPALVPFTGTSLNKIWEGVPNTFRKSIVIVQKNDSYIGEQLALDLLENTQIKVVTVYETNIEIVAKLEVVNVPMYFLLNRDLHTESIPVSQNFHFPVYSDVRSLLLEKGIEVPELKREIIMTTNIDTAKIMAIMEIEEEIKKKLNVHALSDVVFQIDIEKAIQQSLTGEVASHKIISGEKLDALKLYLKTLINFFPFRKKGIDFLNEIQGELKDKSHVSGSDFDIIVKKSRYRHEPFLSLNSDFLGCKGSQPTFRGYPCSLWTLFHTLTVQADQARSSDSKQVLRAIVAYIQNFFGCSDCAQHFMKMAKTMEGNVTTTEESILWLWKAHNNANARLKGDPTEDPKHPKIQFPSQDQCRACRSSSGSWNDKIVLAFLKSMYTNISYFMVEDLPQTSTTPKTIFAKMLRHENIGEEKSFNFSQTESKQLLFNFNILDVSLFVLLYLFSMAIIVLVCIKFLFKKTYRKKIYAYDIFQKV